VPAEHFQRLQEIVESALQAPEFERGIILRRECGDDSELLAEARSLLLLADDPNKLLEPPCPGIGEAVALAAIAADGVDQWYGVYRATELLAAGTGGAVYKGLSSASATVSPVAIKVLRRENCVAETARRFARERRIMAGLNHPGICKFLDAGTREDGSLFIIMEYVDGLPIDQYCKTRPLRERLEQLRSVCRAVAYAHENGVIHRDLKPSNILVGASQHAKVIDFGIARLSRPTGLSETVRTDPGRLMGTLPYMSPEQLSRDPARIDARSDVYALGVLLFQLASGRLPFDFNGRALAQAARLVSECDPQRLASLGRQFRGDLDTIAARALEKNPARRYQSVAELEADLGRFLAHQPIAARPQGFFYRASKFVRRHAALTVAASFVLTILLASIAVVSSAFVQSQREAARARAMSSFLQDLLVSVNPFRLPSGRSGTEIGVGVRVDRLLDDAAERLDSGWIEDRRTEAEVRHGLGLTYAGLNRLTDAERQLRRAVELRSSLFGQSTVTTLESMSALGAVLGSLGREHDAEQLLDAAADGLMHQFGTRDERTFSAIFERASFCVLHHRFQDALADTERMLAAEAGRGETYRLALASAIKSIALISRGDVAAGADIGREALAAMDRTGCRNHYMGGICAGTLAMACELSNHSDDAERYYREAHASFHRILGPDDPRTTEFAVSLGGVLLRHEKFVEAESMLASALPSLEKVFGPSNLTVRRALADLARARRGQGRLDDAAALLDKSLEACMNTVGPDDVATLQTAGWLAGLRCEQGRFVEAEQLARRAHAGLCNSRKVVNDERLLAADTLAASLNGMEKYEEAASIAATALASWHEEPLQDRAVPALLRMHEGEALLGLGRKDEGIKALQESVETLTSLRGASAGITRRAEALLERGCLP
jgi:tetratricopeptide (TPR) repeat protein/predicted Ser/Thr protein kinase